MQKRRFGRTGWEISEIGYGMWGLAGWTGSDRKETDDSLNLAVESGVNFFDTAWGYGEGLSERILGELIKRYRATHPDFPHQSTANQLYDETQFEAYRALGEHVANDLFREDLTGHAVERPNNDRWKPTDEVFPRPGKPTRRTARTAPCVNFS